MSRIKVNKKIFDRGVVSTSLTRTEIIKLKRLQKLTGASPATVVRAFYRMGLEHWGSKGLSGLEVVRVGKFR